MVTSTTHVGFLCQVELLHAAVIFSHPTISSEDYEATSGRRFRGLLRARAELPDEPKIHCLVDGKTWINVS